MHERNDTYFKNQSTTFLGLFLLSWTIFHSILGAIWLTDIDRFNQTAIMCQFVVGVLVVIGYRVWLSPKRISPHHIVNATMQGMFFTALFFGHTVFWLTDAKHFIFAWASIANLGAIGVLKPKQMLLVSTVILLTMIVGSSLGTLLLNQEPTWKLDGLFGFLYAGLSAMSALMTKDAYRRKNRVKAQKIELQALNQQIKEQVLVRYLPPALINDIFEGKVSMDTKPATQDITVLFSDLSGFTRMSEEQGAETVAEFLNDYLTVMNETIFANNGTIDKFIGDAIMVLFGAPVPMSAKEQAENAARCARAMQAGMVLVNEKWKARGLNEVSMRIGIHQGTAVVGNFGSAQRVDYTAIGPSVNLASRIESACIPGEIFVSPEISELLSPELTEQAGEYELKGISGKTSLYRLVGTVSS